MSDLTERLREGVQTATGASHPIASDIDAADALMSEAADKIDRLTAALAEARDKALEEGAKVADEAREMRDRLFSENGALLNASKAVQAEEIAAAIRALKEKP